MRKSRKSDVRVRHKATGLYLLVQNEGKPVAENDLYTRDEGDSSCWRDKPAASVVAKRLGLRSQEFEII